jgi:glycolate oxidase
MKVKDVFDPDWLLNPAKVFPLAASAARREKGSPPDGGDPPRGLCPLGPPSFLPR